MNFSCEDGRVHVNASAPAAEVAACHMTGEHHLFADGGCLPPRGEYTTLSCWHDAARSLFLCYRAMPHPVRAAKVQDKQRGCVAWLEGELKSAASLRGSRAAPSPLVSHSEYLLATHAAAASHSWQRRWRQRFALCGHCRWHDCRAPYASRYAPARSRCRCKHTGIQRHDMCMSYTIHVLTTVSK